MSQIFGYVRKIAILYNDITPEPAAGQYLHQADDSIKKKDPAIGEVQFFCPIAVTAVRPRQFLAPSSPTDETSVLSPRVRIHWFFARLMAVI